MTDEHESPGTERAAKLTHIDDAGKARMADVGDKASTDRRATVEATLVVGRDVMAAVSDGTSPKGNIYETARLAGVMAAKRTSELIPLCHPLSIDHIEIDFHPTDDRIRITASVRTHGPTGVEMEALTAASVAGLTLYDMLKALSHDMVLEGVRLLTKSGGRSGDYRASEYDPDKRAT